MSPYRVSVKESVFEWTGFTPAEFDKDNELQFVNEKDAETWIATWNDRLEIPATLTLHDAHPNDSSGVDAYLTVRQEGYWRVE